MIGWKKNLAKFENEQYKTGLASGEFLLVHGYSGDILQVQEENEDIEFAMPEEGTSISCDDLVIPEGRAERRAGPPVHQLPARSRGRRGEHRVHQYLCPNKPSYAFLSEEILENPAIFLPPEIQAKSEVIDDLGEDNVKYTKVWDEIKAASRRACGGPGGCARAGKLIESAA